MKKVIIVLIAVIMGFTTFAQAGKEKMPAGKMASAAKATYTCPMHPDVVSDKPGKCPKCGMALVQKKMEAKKTYTCSMHPEVVSDKPGKCPKCGMKLVERKTGNDKKMGKKMDRKEG
ncbi:MAG: hypothetical protein NVSMB63_00560 [Sediminibacterium sp.]